MGVEMLEAALASMEQEFLNECQRREAMTAQGHPPPVTYSLGGRSFSWSEYRSKVIDEIQKLRELIVKAQPYEYQTRGWSG